MSGELLGPAPTAKVGNEGPVTQSAARLYAVQPHEARWIGQGAITVGRWWGLIDRRTIPLDAVQTVSLERVVLRLRLYQLTS